MTDGTKWAPGPTYGPVLQQTDLFLLQPKLELHPILTQSLKSFHLVFDLITGRATGYNTESTDRDLAFEAKDEVATLPRVTELYIITRASPWCTVVRNPSGVNLGDIIGNIWTDYKQPVLEEELASLPPLMQDRVKRTAANREVGSRSMQWNVVDYPYQRCLRVDWLRDKRFFDGMEHDDAFAKERLGFTAPNVIVMSLTS